MLRRQSNVREKTNGGLPQLVRCGRHNYVERTLRRKEAPYGEARAILDARGKAFMAWQWQLSARLEVINPTTACSGDSRRFASSKEVGYFTTMVIDSIARIMGGNILKLTGKDHSLTLKGSSKIVRADMAFTARDDH